MRCIILIAFALLLVGSPALAGSIGIYANSDCTGPELQLGPDQFAIVHVSIQVHAGEIWGDAIDATEFRIEGLPAGWQHSLLLDPGVSIAIGDPFGDGVDVGFYAARSGCIHVYSIGIHATTAVTVQNVILNVVTHRHPSPPFGYPTHCPWLHYSCPPPCDTSGVCADPVPLCINCSVSVQPSSWSSVRELYKG